MNNTEKLRNSINDVLAWDGGSSMSKADQILSIFISELWTHSHDDVITLEKLTDAEYRLVGEWGYLNRRTRSQMNRVAFIRDMREVFPGITLQACVRFV